MCIRDSTHTLAINRLLKELYISFPIPFLTDNGSSVTILATILAVVRSFILINSVGTRDGRRRYLKIYFFSFVYE